MITSGKWLWQAQLEEHFSTFYTLPEQQKPGQQYKDENELGTNVEQ